MYGKKKASPQTKEASENLASFKTINIDTVRYMNCCHTVQGILQVLMGGIKTFMALAYPDVPEKTRMYMNRRQEEQRMDIWPMVVPKNMASILMSV